VRDRRRRALPHRRPRRQRHVRGGRLRVLRRYVAAGSRRLLPSAHSSGPDSLKTLTLRMLPGAALIAATVALLSVPALTPLTTSLLPTYPLIAFLAGALLAWRFRRWRVLAATLMLAAAERTLAITLASPTASASVVTAVAAAALPLD